MDIVVSSSINNKLNLFKKEHKKKKKKKKKQGSALKNKSAFFLIYQFSLATCLHEYRLALRKVPSFFYQQEIIEPDFR